MRIGILSFTSSHNRSKLKVCSYTTIVMVELEIGPTLDHNDYVSCLHTTIAIVEERICLQ